MKSFSFLTLDIPAIRSTQRALEIFDRLGYPRKKIRIVVNRWSKQIDLDLRQVEKFLGEPVVAFVPSDYQMRSRFDQPRHTARTSRAHLKNRNGDSSHRRADVARYCANRSLEATPSFLGFAAQEAVGPTEFQTSSLDGEGLAAAPQVNKHYGTT